MRVGKFPSVPGRVTDNGMSSNDNMAVSIRVARETDLPALRVLIEASVRRLSVGYLEPAQIESELRYVISMDTQLIADGTYFVAVAPDGALAGAGGWSRRRALHGGDEYKAAAGAAHGDPNALLDPASEPARIRAMFTHPDWARRGIGRQIFAAAERAAASAGFGSFVLTATMPGMPLYEALGFRVVRRYMDRLPNGVEVPVAEMAREIRHGAPALPEPSAIPRATR
jgi:GNAT superfamily N-acetyltransferase